MVVKKAALFDDDYSMKSHGFFLDYKCSGQGRSNCALCLVNDTTTYFVRGIKKRVPFDYKYSLTFSQQKSPIILQYEGYRSGNMMLNLNTSPRYNTTLQTNNQTIFMEGISRDTKSTTGYIQWSGDITKDKPVDSILTIVCIFL